MPCEGKYKECRCFVTMLGAHGQEMQVIWRYGTTSDLQCFVGFTSINYLNQLPQSINYLINNNSAMLNNSAS